MFSEKNYHFLSVDLGLFEFSLGVLMVATGHTVDVSQLKGTGFLGRFTQHQLLRDLLSLILETVRFM